MSINGESHIVEMKSAVVDDDVEGEVARSAKSGGVATSASMSTSTDSVIDKLVRGCQVSNKTVPVKWCFPISGGVDQPRLECDTTDSALPYDETARHHSWLSSSSCPSSSSEHRGIDCLTSNMLSNNVSGTPFSFWSFQPLSMNSSKSPGLCRLEQGAYCQPTTSLPGYAHTASTDAVSSLSIKSDVGCSKSGTRFACPLCSLTYKRVADMNRHMKQKHRTSLEGWSWSCADATFVSPAPDTSRNFSVGAVSRGRRPRKKRHPCDDALEELPLDLSAGNKIPKTSVHSCAATTTRFSDDAKCFPCNVAALPAFDMRDSTATLSNLNSLTFSSNRSCDVVASSAAAYMPVLSTGFATLMESTYNRLRSYFGDIVRNVAATPAENRLGHRSGKVAAFQQPVFQRSGDDNNNNNSTLKASVATPGNVSVRDGASGTSLHNMFRGFEAVETRCVNDSGGSWGKCPLCSFVCPHPLTMRRHLDVHDEPELQRSTPTRQNSANHITTTSSRTCFELAAVDRPPNLFDVTVCTTYDGAQNTKSTAVNSLSWMSVVSSACGSRSSYVPGWFPSPAFPPCRLTRDGGGRFTGWNSTSGLAVKSSEFQLEPRQNVFPFLSASRTCEDTWRSRDDNVDKCLYRGKRQDVQTHLAELPTDCGQIVSLAPTSTFNHAVTSWSSVSGVCQPWRFSSPSATVTATADWWRGWSPIHDVGNRFSGVEALPPRNDFAVLPATSIHATLTRSPAESWTRVNVPHTDFKKLKRFCCSSCPYRSNFRSDVVRHIRHKHPSVPSAAGVLKLDADRAAATLADYMNTWARKKFVLNSRRRRHRARSPPIAATSPDPPRSSLSGSVHFASPSKSTHVQTSGTDTISNKSFDSGDRHAKDSGLEFCVGSPTLSTAERSWSLEEWIVNRRIPSSDHSAAGRSDSCSSEHVRRLLPSSKQMDGLHLDSSNCPPSSSCPVDEQHNATVTDHNPGRIGDLTVTVNTRRCNKSDETQSDLTKVSGLDVSDDCSSETDSGDRPQRDNRLSVRLIHMDREGQPPRVETTGPETIRPQPAGDRGAGGQ